ncbi:sensor histidine kinase [Oxalobacteraceae bacterium A2-2]
MSLRWRLRAYLIVLHLAGLALTVGLYRERTTLFLAIEAGLLASLALGLWLVGRALEPLNYTRHFHDLLQDQQYAARLKPTGDQGLDQLIAMFNAMLGALYQERLAIGEQRGFLEQLLEATPSAVIVFDFDGRISLLNASAQALLGLDQARGLPLRHWLDGAAVPSGDAAARERSLALLALLDALPLGDSQLLADPGGRRYRAQRGQFHDRGFARHFLLIEELTEELESSERATYEKLVRVLAHEVNNTVAATGSVLESLLYYRTQLAERDAEDFGTAVSAVQRRNASLGQFIQRFTEVVKMPAPELRPVSLADMLDDIAALYREPCRQRGIELAWRRRDEVGPQMLDRELMEQALVNIVKNAMEAAEAGLARRAGQVGLELAQEDGAVRLSVTDSGALEAPPHQLFTPFYSTRKGGQGIGLLFVREVLTRHHYRYRLAAADAHTRFDIWL